MAWTEICRLFDGIDNEMAADMQNLQMPTWETLFRLKACLKNMRCDRKTYLVIDNYHLISFDLHRELINVFSLHENPNLHLIFIAQPLDSRQQLSVHNNHIYTVDASALLFDKVGIAGLFRMQGLRLSEVELETVFRCTEGWIAAICLQIINYRETGCFVSSAGIEPLVENAVWNRLLPAEKDFLLAVSVFDSFTARQAAAMLDNKILPGVVESKLKTSDFIRFIPEKRLFVIHTVLLDYLRYRFQYHQPDEYRQRLLRKAGQVCAALEQYCLAAEFLQQVQDFDSILTLPVTLQYLDEQKEICATEPFTRIVEQCPEEILCRYPERMIVFAHFALLQGQHKLYARLCKLLRRLLCGEARATETQMRRLQGEFILLETLSNFNDLAKMRAGFEAAAAFLKEQPEIMENGMPWFSVFPTASGMFWREAGKLAETLQAVDEIKPIYRKLTRGRGAGLAYLMQAEVKLAGGDDGQAEVLCHMALYEARIYRQISICIYAELCLARVFMLRGDVENFSLELKNIQRYPQEHPGYAVRRMVDMCLAIISLHLGVKDYVAPWLYRLDCMQASLYAPVVPLAEIIYCRLLLLDKRYSELYAICRLTLDAIPVSGSEIKYLLPQLYAHVFTAVAKHNSGRDQEARQHLQDALALALPDQVYLPFVDHECIDDLLAGIAERGNVTTLRAVCKRYAGGIKRIRKALLQSKSPLTPREREIALLAKDRLSAKEIAAKLYVSDATVKSTLRSVYRKLGIHSRRELAAIEF